VILEPARGTAAHYMYFLDWADKTPTSRTLLPTLGEWTRVLDQVKAFEPAGSPRTGSKPLVASCAKREGMEQSKSVHISPRARLPMPY
jgi:hypothetical protein